MWKIVSVLDLVEKASSKSDDDILTALKQRTLADLETYQQDLKCRLDNLDAFGLGRPRQQHPYMEAVFGKPPDLMPSLEEQTLCRLMHLCSTAIQRKHYEIPMSRKGYRAEVRAWMQRKQIKTVALAARRLGVSESVLKSIMSSRGTPRYGQERLQHVLAGIGVTQASD